MNTASMTAFRKCRKGLLVFSVLAVLFLMALLFMSHFHSAVYEGYGCYAVTVMLYILFACCLAIGPISAVRAKRRDEPALKIYEDRIEYRQTIFKEEYDRYYFQDMKSVEINGTEAVLSFDNDVSRKIDFNDLDCYMYDFFEEIQARFKAYGESSQLNAENGSHIFKSKFHEEKDGIAKVRKYIDLISGATMLAVPMWELLKSVPLMRKSERIVFSNSMFTFVLVMGIFAMLAVIGSRKEGNKKGKRKADKEKW